ncbi:MAG: hypothetical protein HC904_01950 [Blastochloris sp.]|nr:hypothetical protein [Blastochloris sp.]
MDYVLKPFRPQELLARVRTHLELKLTHDRLLRLNEEKNALMQMAAHDLRNPLTALTLSLEVMAGHENLPEEMHQEILDAQGLTDRMQRLLKNLLDSNAIESGYRKMNPEVFDLVSLLQEVCISLHGSLMRKKLCLNCDLPSAPLRVFLDREATQQVVENLLGNAIKFSPELKNIHLRLESETRLMRIRIRDEAQASAGKTKPNYSPASVNSVPVPPAGRNPPVSASSLSISWWWLFAVKSLVRIRRNPALNLWSNFPCLNRAEPPRPHLVRTSS